MDNKAIKSVINSVLCLIPADDLRELARLQDKSFYAALQLGTSSQIAAQKDIDAKITDILDNVSQYYLREIKMHISKTSSAIEYKYNIDGYVDRF